jgi:hypothetical protein
MMNNLDPQLLNLLALVLGLSVYVATVRLVVLGRLIADPAPSADKKARYKTFLGLLALADLPIVTAGALLFVKFFRADLHTRASGIGSVRLRSALVDFLAQPPWWLDPTILWLMTIPIAYLVILHVFASLRSLFSLLWMCITGIPRWLAWLIFVVLIVLAVVLMADQIGAMRGSLWSALRSRFP